MVQKQECNHSSLLEDFEVWKTFLDHTIKAASCDFFRNDRRIVTLLFNCNWGLTINNKGICRAITPSETKNIFEN